MMEATAPRSTGIVAAVVFSIRRATEDDERFLVAMLYQALFVPPGEPPLPPEITDRPDLARYAHGFGSQPGDHGWIAEAEGGASIGAAWVRQLPADDPGYGFVDGSTPELSIAVVPAARSRGAGSALLESLLAEVPRCSLAVDDRNPAVRLYERRGFEVVSQSGHSLTMLRP